MTTIAFRDGVMCSDSQATRGDFIDNTCTTKIYEVGGCLVGISGNAISAKKFVEWFSEMAEHSVAQESFPFVNITLPEKLVEEDFHALVAYPDNTLYEFFGCDNIIECAEEYAAVGSGMQYALCAMDSGASSEDAVAVAIKRDVYSGGDIQKFTLKVEEELSEEDVRNMSREQLLKLVLGEEEEVSAEDSTDVSEHEHPNITYTDVPKQPRVLWQINTESFGSFCIREDGTIINPESTISSLAVVPCSTHGFTDGYCIDFLKEAADSLSVKYTHNISAAKLCERLNKKVQEMIDSHEDS